MHFFSIPSTEYIAIMPGARVPRLDADPERKVDDTIHPVPSHGRGESEATGPQASNDTAVDDAAKYLATASQFASLTPEREKKLRQKINLWMIPLVRKSP